MGRVKGQRVEGTASLYLLVKIFAGDWRYGAARAPTLRAGVLTHARIHTAAGALLEKVRKYSMMQVPNISGGRNGKWVNTRPKQTEWRD